MKSYAVCEIMCFVRNRAVKFRNAHTSCITPPEVTLSYLKANIWVHASILLNNGFRFFGATAIEKFVRDIDNDAAFLDVWIFQAILLIRKYFVKYRPGIAWNLSAFQQEIVTSLTFKISAMKINFYNGNAELRINQFLTFDF